MSLIAASGRILHGPFIIHGSLSMGLSWGNEKTPPQRNAQCAERLQKRGSNLTRKKLRQQEPALPDLKITLAYRWKKWNSLPATK